MNHPAEPLPPDLQAWIGRETRRDDSVTPRLAESFRATLAPHLAAQSGAPLGLHWCLAPDVVEAADLGPDGHPRPGLLLPPLPYPRRMWAGGEVTFHHALSVADAVTKASTVADIAFKTGRSGRLGFVTVRHSYRAADRLVIEERQDLVYRDAEGGGVAAPAVDRPVADEPDRSERFATDPTLLFRYSALTFNGHRIHYDRPYAIEQEGYGGLVVHGPIQATLLLNLAGKVAGSVPLRFSYRGLSPLLCGEPATLEAKRTDDGSLSLRVVKDSGVTTMTAQAQFR